MSFTIFVTLKRSVINQLKVQVTLTFPTGLWDCLEEARARMRARARAQMPFFDGGEAVRVTQYIWCMEYFSNCPKFTVK